MKPAILDIFADTAIYPDIQDVIGEFRRSMTESITGDIVLSQIMPSMDVNGTKCKLFLEDEDWGVMKGRGVNNDFPNAPTPGFDVKEYTPGYFGEKRMITEEAALKVRAAGTEEAPGVLSEEIGRHLRVTRNRMIRLMKKSACDILFRGSVEVRNEMDQIIYRDNLSVPLVVVGTSWSNHSNSTPVKNIQDQKLTQQLHADAGEFDWDQNSKILISPEIEAHLNQNRNASDLYGYFRQLNIVPGTLAAINQVMSALGLPQFEVYSGRYQATQGATRTYFGSTDHALWIGNSAERGIKVGAFQMTKNYQLGGAPGMFAKVIPDSKGLFPPEVYGGFNGGVGIWNVNQIERVKVVF